MFYKDQSSAGHDRNPSHIPTLSKKQSHLEDDESKPFSHSGATSSHQMEALLAKKQEQLERAIQRYNQDNESLS